MSLNHRKGIWVEYIDMYVTCMTKCTWCGGCHVTVTRDYRCHIFGASGPGFLDFDRTADPTSRSYIPTLAIALVLLAPTFSYPGGLFLFFRGRLRSLSDRDHFSAAGLAHTRSFFSLIQLSTSNNHA